MTTTAAERRIDRYRLVVLGFAQLGLSIPAYAIGVASVVMLSLIWTWVALPALFALVAATRAVANLHRRLAGVVLDTEIPPPYRPAPPGGWFARLRGLATDPATWRDLAWLLVNFVVVMSVVVTALSLFLGVAWQLVLPLLHAIWPDVFNEFYGFVTIDSTLVALLISWPIAVVYYGLWRLLMRPLMLANAEATRWLLAPTERARLTSRVHQLTESRAQTVDAQAAELRRIERDLHDGAQARLVALGMNIGLAEDLLARDPDAAKQLLVEARQSSSTALAELRDLVRGIHPPVLADRGLDGAIQALAMANSLPVYADVELVGRPSAPVESAAYFAVAETLTNVAKHSGASSAWIRVRHTDGVLSLMIGDDGCGGADPANGTGLRGIERRLAAFDGALVVASPAGGPTIVTMELPCELSSPKISPSSGMA